MKDERGKLKSENGKLGTGMDVGREKKEGGSGGESLSLCEAAGYYSVDPNRRNPLLLLCCVYFGVVRFGLLTLRT